MAEKKTSRSAMKTTATKGFTAEERAAMKERARELRERLAQGAAARAFVQRAHRWTQSL